MQSTTLSVHNFLSFSVMYFVCNQLEFNGYGKTFGVFAIRLMHSGDEGNWVTEIMVSGRKRFLYINICRPVLRVCVASECSQYAGMCATEVVHNKVCMLCCMFIILHAGRLVECLGIGGVSLSMKMKPCTAV